MNFFQADKGTWIFFLAVIVPATIFIAYLIIDSIIIWFRKRQNRKDMKAHSK